MTTFPNYDLGLIATAATAALLTEIAGDALLALPAALAAVLLAHATESKDTLAIKLWKKASLLLGSVALAVTVGHAVRETESTAKFAGLAIVASSLVAQDVMLLLTVKLRQRLQRLADQAVTFTPEKPDKTPDETPKL